MNGPDPPRGKVVLARHGETAWSLSGQHTGRTDIPLTDEGRRQAERLGGRVAARQFALVLTSPLSRAVDTCGLAGLEQGATVDEDLLEWDYGDYDGRTTADIREKRPGWDLWEEGVPGGEALQDVGRRADRVIERARAAGGDVALFGHGHMLRVLAARWVGLPAADGRRLALVTASMSVLGWERETPVIEIWNQTAGA